MRPATPGLPPVTPADQWTDGIDAGYCVGMTPPASNNTPQRVVRVQNELWERFGEACAAVGISRSDELRLHMSAFVEEYERKQQRRAREAAASAKDA